MNFLSKPLFSGSLLALLVGLPLSVGHAATVSSTISPIVLGDGDITFININSTFGSPLDAISDLRVSVRDLGQNGVLNVQGVSGSQVSNVAPGSSSAQRYAVGDSVGPSLSYAGTTVNLNAAIDNASFGISLGQWGGGETGYIGLRFNAAGSVHYGFVRLSWFPDDNQFASDSFAVIDQIGFNTTPGEPAVILPIPEPSSALLLLLAGLPIAMVRRR